MHKSSSSSVPSRDIWSDWLLAHRHGSDDSHAQTVQEALEEVRDKVLDGVQVLPGMTLVDIGSGDGLIAFGALQRVKNDLAVVLTDISKPMLAHAEQIAKDLGVVRYCTFLETPAECLQGLGDAEADALTCRAVLAYVEEKQLAISEFFRVLKPGGRVSIAEPIHRDHAVRLAQLGASLIGVSPSQEDILSRIVHRYQALQFPATAAAIQNNCMTNFTERDLVALFQDAGFCDIHMEFHVDIKKSPGMSWNAFLDSAPFPGAATQRELFGKHFASEEVMLLEKTFRTLVEKGEGHTRTSVAYLTAVKPGI